MDNTATQLKPSHQIPQAWSLPTVEFAVKKVDVDNRSISGVTLAQVGEAQGHGIHIEESFLQDMVDFIAKDLKGSLRSNFNHNHDNLGLQLGRFSSITKKAGKVTGNLQVFESADESPVFPNMGSWFLKLASEDPGSVMCSIRFIPAYYYQYDKDGKEVIMEDYDWWTGRWENQNPQENVYAKFGEILSCDIVAEGAITDSLFSRKLNHSMSKETNTPEGDKSAIAQLTEGINKLVTKLSVHFSEEEETEETEEVEETEEQETETEETETEETQENSSEELKALNKQVSDLTKVVEELSKQPAGKHTRGKKDPSEYADDEEGFVSKSPVTQRAIEIYDRMNRNKKEKPE